MHPSSIVKNPLQNEFPVAIFPNKSVNVPGGGRIVCFIKIAQLRLEDTKTDIHYIISKRNSPDEDING